MESVEKVLSIRFSKQKQVAAKRENLGDGKTSSGSGYSRSVGLSGRVGCYGNVRIVQQVWNLLASSIDVMSHKPRESSPSLTSCKSSTSVSSSSSSLGLSSVKSDSMPMGDGSGFNWTHSVLGRSLLCRCVNLLRQNGDLQTLATVACIFGGSDHLVGLMTEGRRTKIKMMIVRTKFILNIFNILNDLH